MKSYCCHLQVVKSNAKLWEPIVIISKDDRYCENILWSNLIWNAEWDTVTRPQYCEKLLSFFLDTVITYRCHPQLATLNAILWKHIVSICQDDQYCENLSWLTPIWIAERYTVSQPQYSENLLSSFVATVKTHRYHSQVVTPHAILWKPIVINW